MKKFKKKKVYKNIPKKKNNKIKLSKKSFFIYGVKPVFEFLYSNPKEINNIFLSQEKKIDQKNLAKIKRLSKNNFNILSVDNSFIKKNVGEDINHQGILAEINSFQYYDFNQWKKETEKKEKELVLVLDKIEDTHNFGAIIRTAAASEVSAIFIGSHNQASINGTVFKTSAGNIMKVPIIQVSNINDIIQKLKNEKFWIYGLDMSNKEENNLFNQKFDNKTVIVLGAEGKGISKKTLEHCDFITSIPMERGVESLNVSVSAAIVMYEWKRQNK